MAGNMDCVPFFRRWMIEKVGAAIEVESSQLILGPMLNRPSREHPGLDVRFGFAQAGDAIAGLPKAALFENFHPLKAFEHVSFCARGAGRAQTAML